MVTQMFSVSSIKSLLPGDIMEKGSFENSQSSNVLTIYYINIIQNISFPGSRKCPSL